MLHYRSRRALQSNEAVWWTGKCSASGIIIVNFKSLKSDCQQQTNIVNQFTAIADDDYTAFGSTPHIHMCILTVGSCSHKAPSTLLKSVSQAPIGCLKMMMMMITIGSWILSLSQPETDLHGFCRLVCTILLYISLSQPPLTGIANRNVCCYYPYECTLVPYQHHCRNNNNLHTSCKIIIIIVVGRPYQFDDPTTTNMQLERSRALVRLISIFMSSWVQWWCVCVWSIYRT